MIKLILNCIVNFKRILQESFWVISGQIIFILGSVYLVKLLTTILSPDQYGELALILTLNGFFVQVIFSSITPGSSRFYSESKKKNQIGNFLNAIINLNFKITKYTFLISLLVVILLFIFKVKLVIIIATILALIYSFNNGFVSVLNSIYLASRNHKNIAINQSLDIILKIIIVLAFVSFFESSSIIALIAFVLSTVILVFLNYIISNQKFKTFLSQKNDIIKWKKKIWNYSWPFMVWGILNSLQIYSDRWSLLFFSTKESVGLYSVIYQYGFTMMAIGSGVFINLLTPIIFNKVEDGDNFFIEKTTKSIIIVGLVLTFILFIIFFFFHKVFFSFLVDFRYLGVSYLLPWMILAGGIHSISQAYSLILMAKKKIMTLFPIKIFSSSLGIIFNLLGAKFLGITGIVIANILYSTIFLIFLYHATNKILKKNI